MDYGGENTFIIKINRVDKKGSLTNEGNRKYRGKRRNKKDENNREIKKQQNRKEGNRKREEINNRVN
jgi:hypothetical protein